MKQITKWVSILVTVIMETATSANGDPPRPCVMACATPAACCPTSPTTPLKDGELKAVNETAKATIDVYKELAIQVKNFYQDAITFLGILVSVIGGTFVILGVRDYRSFKRNLLKEYDDLRKETDGKINKSIEESRKRLEESIAATENQIALIKSTAETNIQAMLNTLSAFVELKVAELAKQVADLSKIVGRLSEKSPGLKSSKLDAVEEAAEKAADTDWRDAIASMEKAARTDDRVDSRILAWAYANLVFNCVN